MADARITDYTNVEVSTGAIIDPSWANTETGNIETSINNGNDVMVDLEQNYASSTEPTSKPNGKFWYDSSASADYAKLRAGGAWAIVPHDGMTTAFAFGDGLTVASNFAVSGAADFAGEVSVGAGLIVASNFAVSGTADFAGAVSVGAGLIVASNAAVAGTLTVSGAASFVSAVSVGANIEVSSAVIGGNLTVSGAADFAGAVSVGAGLVVASNAAVSGTMTVSGAASFISAVSVGANIEVSNAVVGGTLTVSGAADFAGEVSVGAGFTVASNAAVAGSFSVASATYGATKAEFNNLLFDVSSSTTVTISATRIMCINSDGIPKFIDNVALTGTVPTDLPTGVTLYASMWQAVWVDSDSNVVIVPEFASTTTTVAASKLADSSGAFVTNGVTAGDIVYNTTDLTKTTVTAVDSATVLSVADDIFAEGETYQIHQLSPTGIGSFKAHIGYAFCNSGSELDDSTYAQIQGEKKYDGGTSEFAITGTPTVTSVTRGIVYVRQSLDWTGIGVWKINGNIVTNCGSAARTNGSISLGGVTFKNVSGFDQPISARTNAVVTFQFASATPNTGTLSFQHASGTTTKYYYSFDVECDKKPTFHT